MQHHIIRPQIHTSFEKQWMEMGEQIEEFRQELGEDRLLALRIYLTDSANQWNAICTSVQYAQWSKQFFISYIEQPLLMGEKIACHLVTTEQPIVAKRVGEGRGEFSLASGATLLLQTVRFSTKNCSSTAYEQTQMAFEVHRQWLATFGATLKDNCHRTWIYVRDVDNHYAEVVNARNLLFEKEGLSPSTHFIASTGIEGRTAVGKALVAMDFLSVLHLPISQVKYLSALDFLNPTHEYGVAFERATSIRTNAHRYALLSGTASIDRNGKCVAKGSIEEQTVRTMVNVAALLKDDGMTTADLQYLIIYIRDVADTAFLQRYFATKFPNLPVLLTLAPVCRPEWLIEVEGIAQKIL